MSGKGTIQALKPGEEYMGHDAILQVRADRQMTDDETRSVHTIVGKYCSGVDYEYLEARRGIDVYVANVASARHAAARIMKVLGGSRKESSKYVRVQGGRVLYQFTIRVKLPDEVSGAKYGFGD
ncbi:MAG: 60S ribosomal export protein NMD3 [ANME-2 cluster archaeon]|nr:60S ribosomal export protein NMD3 [ANME-2 cluster archaeon]